MAVVSTTSDLYSNDFDFNAITPNPERSRGKNTCATFTATNTATDSALSKYKLCSLPSDCILDSRTAFLVSGWGFADIRIGTFSDPAALVSVLKSAGATVVPVAFGDQKHGLPLWQALGMAANPTGEIDLYAHAIAAATGAGSMKGEVHYRYRG